MFLLAVAALIATASSAPASHATALAAHGILFAQPAPRPEPIVSYNSVAAHVPARVYIEDTPPPSPVTLETAQVSVLSKSSHVPRPAAPPFQNTLTSVANRQRAP